MQWLYGIYTAEDCLARLLGTFWTKLRVRLSFSPSSMFSDDRHAMARTPSCIRAISALPYPLPLATYATARPKGTRHPRPPVFFPSRLLSGKTCDSPLQIINISFQRIPHLMLTVGISGSFDIFFYIYFQLLQRGYTHRIYHPAHRTFSLELICKVGTALPHATMGTLPGKHVFCLCCR